MIDDKGISFRIKYEDLDKLFTRIKIEKDTYRQLVSFLVWGNIISTYIFLAEGQGVWVKGKLGTKKRDFFKSKFINGREDRI